VAIFSRWLSQMFRGAFRASRRANARPGWQRGPALSPASRSNSRPPASRPVLTGDRLGRPGGPLGPGGGNIQTSNAKDPKTKQEQAHYE
jgi:hypothetical protein